MVTPDTGPTNPPPATALLLVDVGHALDDLAAMTAEERSALLWPLEAAVS